MNNTSLAQWKDGLTNGYINWNGDSTGCTEVERRPRGKHLDGVFQELKDRISHMEPCDSFQDVADRINILDQLDELIEHKYDRYEEKVGKLSSARKRLLKAVTKERISHTKKEYYGLKNMIQLAKNQAKGIENELKSQTSNTAYNASRTRIQEKRNNFQNLPQYGDLRATIRAEGAENNVDQLLRQSFIEVKDAFNLIYDSLEMNEALPPPLNQQIISSTDKIDYNHQRTKWNRIADGSDALLANLSPKVELYNAKKEVLDKKQEFIAKAEEFETFKQQMDFPEENDVHELARSHQEVTHALDQLDTFFNRLLELDEVDFNNPNIHYYEPKKAQVNTLIQEYSNLKDDLDTKLSLYNSKKPLISLKQELEQKLERNKQKGNLLSEKLSTGMENQEKIRDAKYNILPVYSDAKKTYDDAIARLNHLREERAELKSQIESLKKLKKGKVTKISSSVSSITKGSKKKARGVWTSFKNTLSKKPKDAKIIESSSSKQITPSTSETKVKLPKIESLKKEFKKLLKEIDKGIKPAFELEAKFDKIEQKMHLLDKQLIEIHNGLKELPLELAKILRENLQTQKEMDKLHVLINSNDLNQINQFFNPESEKIAVTEEVVPEIVEEDIQVSTYMPKQLVIEDDEEETYQSTSSIPVQENRITELEVEEESKASSSSSSSSARSISFISKEEFINFLDNPLSLLDNYPNAINDLSELLLTYLKAPHKPNTGIFESSQKFMNEFLFPVRRIMDQTDAAGKIDIGLFVLDMKELWPKDGSISVPFIVQGLLPGEKEKPKDFDALFLSWVIEKVNGDIINAIEEDFEGAEDIKATLSLIPGSLVLSPIMGVMKAAAKAGHTETLVKKLFSLIKLVSPASDNNDPTEAMFLGIFEKLLIRVLGNHPTIAFDFVEVLEKILSKLSVIEKNVSLKLKISELVEKLSDLEEKKDQIKPKEKKSYDKKVNDLKAEIAKKEKDIQASNISVKETIAEVVPRIYKLWSKIKEEIISNKDGKVEQQLEYQFLASIQKTLVEFSPVFAEDKSTEAYAEEFGNGIVGELINSLIENTEPILVQAQHADAQRAAAPVKKKKK